jgi:hypothetical protein
LSRIFKPFVFLVASIYFLLDGVVWMLAKPVIRWLADHWIFDSVRTWVMSLGPYPTLALFVVPVLVLEPAKPFAAYLTATGHVAGGLMVFGVAELLKLALIERLFRIGRDKLMSIRGFAWGYGKFQQVRSSIESIDAWRHARRVALIAKRAIRRYVLEFNESRKREHVSWQSH